MDEGGQRRVCFREDLDGVVECLFLDLMKDVVGVGLGEGVVAVL